MTIEVKSVMLLLLAFGLNINSQTDSVKVFTLPELRISQKEKGKEVIYRFDDDNNKFTITEINLIADTNIYKYKVSLNDVTKISIRNGTHFWSGAAFGAILGFAAGFVLGGNFTLNDNPGNFSVAAALLFGTVCAIPIGLIGGLFGLLSHNYEDYKLNGAALSKYNRLIKIFRNNRL